MGRFRRFLKSKRSLDFKKLRSCALKHGKVRPQGDVLQPGARAVWRSLKARSLLVCRMEISWMTSAFIL